MNPANVDSEAAASADGGAGCSASPSETYEENPCKYLQADSRVQLELHLIFRNMSAAQIIVQDNKYLLHVTGCLPTKSSKFGLVTLTLV